MSDIALRPEWHATVPHGTRLQTTFGFAFLLALFIGFGTWAGSAPIAGAIVTTGSFVASGQNKTIQHLEGGVIREIRVKEGDVVVPGQSLVLLDDTAPKAELRRLVLREARLAATEARLDAELNEKDVVTFPSELAAQSADPDIVAILRNQVITFMARVNNLKSDLATLKDGIDGLEEKIKGSEQQRQSVHDQLALLQQELDAKNWLLKGGEIRKSEVLALLRAKANAEGELGRLDGDIGEARERISRTREQMLGARNGAIKAAAEQLNDIHADQNDTRERIRSARALLGRIDIVAPERGIVVKQRYFTPGGVIEPGKSVMEIVPLGEELIIEARVRPQDIANLKSGQVANVRLTALSARVTPMVQGHVVYVSADALPDDKRGQYSPADQYVARIRLDRAEADRVKQFAPMPGMPAEVYIKTTERTFLQYLTKPIRDSMQHAFRET